MLQEDTEEWEILVSLNLLDLEPYLYIMYLFDLQGNHGKLILRYQTNRRSLVGEQL